MSPHESVSAVGVPAAASVLRPSRRSTAWRRAPFLAAGLAFVAVLTTHLIDFGADDLRSQLFNADSDRSWSHILTAVIIVVSMAVALVGARRRTSAASLWTAAAAILAFLAVDEISPLHDRIDATSWGKLVYTPILVALCVCLWRLSARTVHSVVVRAGLATLVVAFAIHVFGPHIISALGFGMSSWPYQVKVALKEGAESAGWILLVMGLALLARSSE
jgi:hypothetical protein